MFTIQIDERTAKTIETAAILAGVSVADYVSQLVADKMQCNSR